MYTFIIMIVAILIIIALIIIPLKINKNKLIKKKERCKCHCTGTVTKIVHYNNRCYGDLRNGDVIKEYHPKVNFKVDKQNISAISFECCAPNMYSKGEQVEVYYNANDLHEIYIKKI